MPRALASVYRELVEAGRWDEFRWLARSQGGAAENIAELWEGLLARTRRAPLPPGSHAGAGPRPS